MNSYARFQSIVSLTVFLARWRVWKDAAEVTVERKHIFCVLLAASSHLSPYFWWPLFSLSFAGTVSRVCSAQEPWTGDLGPWLLWWKPKGAKHWGEPGAGPTLSLLNWQKRWSYFFKNIICGISHTKDETQTKSIPHWRVSFMSWGCYLGWKIGRIYR